MNAPIYIEIENYGDVLKIVDKVKAELLTASQLVAKIHDLRAQEDTEINQARMFLNDMKHRLRDIDEELLL